MDTPGITVAPLEMINGVREFAEVFFDDVVVPADRILGEVERRVGRRDEHPARTSGRRASGSASRTCTGGSSGSSKSSPTTTAAPRSSATRSCSSTRCARGRAPRSTGWPTGETLGAETSIDKMLVATGEHATYDACAACSRASSRPTTARGRRDVAQRVPVLAGGDDLRRHRRGAAQHHRPAPARSRGRRLMDAAERALLDDDGAARRSRHAGDDRDDRCARASSAGSTCWRPSPTTRSTSCSARSARTNASATALDDVVASALGVTPRADLAVLLPPFGAWDPPGRLAGGHVNAAGSATARGRRPASCSSCARPRRTSRAVTVPVAVGRRAPGARHRSRRRLPRGTCRAATRSTPTRRSTRGVGRRGRLRPAGGCAPDRGRDPHDARARARRTRPSGCSSVGPIASLPSRAAPSRRRARRGRGARGDAGRGRRRAGRGHRGAREGDRRAHRAHGRRALPAGARRDRLHHRPSVPPLPEAHDAARRAVRHPPTRSRSTSAGNSWRRAACRRSSSSDRKAAEL